MVGLSVAGHKIYICVVVVVYYYQTMGLISYNLLMRQLVQNSVTFWTVILKFICKLRISEIYT